LGGLSVAAGSHKLGFTEDSYVFTKGLFHEVPEDKYELDWRWSEFDPGDVIMFKNTTFHRGLPNTSNRIRLSGDFRFQKKGEKTDFTSKKRMDWYFRYKDSVYEKAGKLGADDFQREAILRKMLKDNASPTPRAISKTYKELFAPKNNALSSK
jgi:ectoine hydroxylase-related dioxygenase (phytanoyl-CoA dioxygenase family)